MSNPRKALIVAGATLAGVALGWAAIQGRQRMHRAELFSGRPSRRAAALGFLAGQPSVETIHLLRDYLRWESVPALRRRGQALVARMEARLA
jgi:hypothetical protein